HGGVHLAVGPAPVAGHERSPLGVIEGGALEQLRDVHGMSSTLPVVLRPSSARCASAAPLSGNSNAMRSFSLPSRIQPNSSPARCCSYSRVAMWTLTLGRLRNS